MSNQHTISNIQSCVESSVDWYDMFIPINTHTYTYIYIYIYIHPVYKFAKDIFLNNPLGLIQDLLMCKGGLFSYLYNAVKPNRSYLFINHSILEDSKSSIVKYQLWNVIRS